MSLRARMGVWHCNRQCPPALRTLSGHPISARAVAFHPNGELALSASEDRTLKLWELRTEI